MYSRAAYAVGGKGIDALEFRDVELGKPGPGEALVRLRAATLNFRDLLFIKGLLPRTTKLPDYVPLSCGAGEVLAVGAGVTRVRVGQRVSPIFHQGWINGPMHAQDMLGGTADGTARTHAVFPVESLCLLPDELGDLEAATLPCAGLTAWSALFGQRPIRPGEWIATHGTGGVSMAAVQWAKAVGANVVITSSSDAKLKRARSHGADITINYRSEPDWAAAARRKLGGKGVDIVVDNAGGTQLAASGSLLNDGGVIAAIGMLDGEFSRGKDPGGKQMVAIAVGNRDQHEAMLAFAAQHRIHPVIDVVYDLSRLGAAMRHHESGRFFGKVGINLLLERA
jgi:NADPH:quinone reductase-like Zn-dependent oxidoreductase